MAKKISKYDESFETVARKNGEAIKVSTTKAEGAYDVRFGVKCGADILMSVIYLIAADFKAAESVTAESAQGAFEALESNWDSKGGKLYTKLMNAYNAQRIKDDKKPWDNYKNLKSRFLKGVRLGAILNLVPKDGTDPKDVVAALRAN